MGMPELKDVLWRLIDEMTNEDSWKGAFLTIFQGDFNPELVDGRVLVKKEQLAMLVAELKKQCGVCLTQPQLLHLLNLWDLTAEESLDVNIHVVDGEETFLLTDRIRELSGELVEQAKKS